MTTINGYVYCLTNRFMPTVCKIGYTNICPENRAKQLSSTSVPGEFKVEFSIYVEDAYTAEQYIHKKLKHKRVYPKKEFFECDISEVKIHFDEYVNNSKIIEKPVYAPNMHIVKNDMEAIDIMLKDLIGTLVFSNDEIYYKKENKLYLLKDNNELAFFVLNYDFIKYTDVKKQIVYNKNINTIKKFCNSIVMKIKLTPANHINDIKKQMYESTLGKICFNNGVYIFLSHQFIPWSDSRVSNVYTPFIINRDYDPNVENYKEEMKHCRKILKTLFNYNNFPSFLYFLSLILAGYKNDLIKMTVFHDGHEFYNILTFILEKLFGDEYIFYKDLTYWTKKSDPYKIPLLSRIVLHRYIKYDQYDDYSLFSDAYSIKEHYCDVINKIDHQFTIWINCSKKEVDRINKGCIFMCTDRDMLNKIEKKDIKEIVDNFKLLLSTNNKYVDALTNIIFNSLNTAHYLSTHSKLDTS
jgi:hypothetical protein